MKQLLLLLVLLILLPCAAQAQDFTHDSIKIDRHQRHFYFKKPNNKSAKNLLFVLHFSGGTAQDMITMAATLQAKADAENLLIVYPQGYKSYWNDCRKASNAAANIENIDELAFFEAMIQYCTKNYGIDPKKIYAAGFSGGGHIAYKLALNLRTPLAGIAAVAARLPATRPHAPALRTHSQWHQR
jgi:polyhydroxybutyrate depolymerase